MKEAHTIYHLEPKLDDSSGNGYVGVCVSRGFDARIRHHTLACGHSTKLYAYLRKRYFEQGAIKNSERKKVFKKCFSVVVLYEEVCSRRDAELLERGFILELDTLSPNGLNLMTGNYRGAHSAEARKKMSEAHKGRKHSDEYKKMMSEACKGRVFSEEHKQKLSKAGMGRKLSEEHKRKMSKSKKGAMISEEVLRKRIGKRIKLGRKYLNAVKLTLEFRFK